MMEHMIVDNNFQVGSRVQITYTASNLDGRKATILGWVELFPTYFYILQLDEPADNGHIGILMIDACVYDVTE